MTLAERRASAYSSWPHNPVIGKHFPFVLGIGAISWLPTQSYKYCFLSGRSLDSRVTNLANLGAIANPGHLREYEAQGGLRERFLGRVARR